MFAPIIAANVILYCREWEATVRFYRDRLGLPVNAQTDWFVEFRLTDSARLSVADERRASIKSCGGAGITVTLQVSDIDRVWMRARGEGLAPTEVKDHPWGARVFYLTDPEGHRLEVWQEVPAGAAAGGTASR